jgi:hypothetical protein
VEEIDAIIYATGYKISFPFFDEQFLSAPGNVLPLYKRLFAPGIDDVAFVGLAQPIPTIFPFVECQAALLAAWLAGEWAPPSPAEMVREMATDDRRFSSGFTPRPRHTMMHFTAVYDYDLRRKVLPAGRRRAEQGLDAPLAGRAGRPSGPGLDGAAATGNGNGRPRPTTGYRADPAPDRVRVFEVVADGQLRGVRQGP